MANCPRTFRSGLCVSASLAAIVVCVGQAATRGPSQQASPATRPAATADRDPKVDDIESLVLTRPPVPITPPRQKRRRKLPPPVLPRDGSTVAGRTCRLAKEQDSDWYLLTFEPLPDQPPEPARRVLPCRWLERMQLLAEKSSDVRFRIWGENTVYRRHCYLLPIRVALIGPSPASGAAAPATRPAGGSSRPSIEDIRRELLHEPPARTITAPPESAPGQEPRGQSVAPHPGRPCPPRRGPILVDRVGRILPGPARTWRLLRFEADNTLHDPPLRLLPCRMLRRAETLGTARLRVTGLITRYKGRRYLLLRKVLRQRELGRF